MNTYTINSINDDGSVDVTFSIDKKSQNISGLPIGDATALDMALQNYGVAYAAGLALVAPVDVPADVTALVGKAQNIDPVLAEQDAPPLQDNTVN